MTGQLTNFDIHVQTLGEEIHIKLIVTMILEEIDFIRGHGHFAVIIFQTGFINDKTAIRHHKFAEVGFLAFHSAGNAKVRPDLAALFHILFGKIGGIGGFTSTGDTKIQREGNRLCFHMILLSETETKCISKEGVRRAHAHPPFFVTPWQTADA